MMDSRRNADHDIDPAIAAQGRSLGRYNISWAPKKQNDEALRAVTKQWAQALAKAWNGGRPVTVKHGNVGVGASTTTEDDLDMIWLDDAVLLPRSAKDLAAAVGIVVHEIGHLFYTPKLSDRFIQEINAQGLFPTFNMVEDGKQEMKLLAYRPGFEKYLRWAILRHLLATVQPQTIQALYPVIAGRTYLPENLRAKARMFCAMAYGDDVVDEFDDLLQDFYAIDVYANPMEAAQIISDIKNLFPTQVGCGSAPTNGDTKEDPKDWNPIKDRKKKSKKKDKDKVSKDKEKKPGSDDDAEHDDQEKDAGGGDEDMDWLDEDFEEGEGEEQEGEKAKAKSDADLDVSSDSDSDGDGDEEDESSGESEDASNESGGEGAGGASDAPPPDAQGDGGAPEENSIAPEDLGTPEELLEKLQTMSDSLQDRIAQDYEEDFELIKSEAFGDGNIRKPLWNETAMQRNMVAALKQLAEQAKGGLDRRRPKGRLNVGRYARGRDRMDIEKIVFDKFRPNVQDALDMEVVLLVDNSGSIYHVQNELSGVMWALVTALESVGGPAVTVVLWNSNFQLWKVPSEKWRAKYVPTIQATGGTSPGEAIKFAGKLFKNSRKKQKVCFILTDGWWSNMQEAKLLIEGMKKASDVDTYILGFGGFDPANINDYGAVDGSGGGVESVTDFIFKVVEKRIQQKIANS
jgi:hypothetical protein